MSRYRNRPAGTTWPSMRQNFAGLADLNPVAVQCAAAADRLKRRVFRDFFRSRNALICSGFSIEPWRPWTAFWRSFVYPLPHLDDPRRQAQQRMYVIGISSGIKHGHHDGAAVLLRDGELIAAAEEERFTLAKHARGELPRGAIGFCLKQAGITMRDVDFICSPLRTYTNYERRLTEYFKYQFGHSPKIELYDHHLCHAASSYYGSGFSEATVACFDFSGNSSSGMVAHVKGNDFKVLTRFGRHNSLGLYYGMLTQYLGYQMTNDEYKVMGLSSYGSPKYLDKFARPAAPERHRLSARRRARQAPPRRRDLHQRFLDAAGAHLHREARGCARSPPAARAAARPALHRHRGQRPEAARDRHDGSDPYRDRANRLRRRVPRRRRRAELQDEHGDRGRAVGRPALCSAGAARCRRGAGRGDAEMRGEPATRSRR